MVLLKQIDDHSFTDRLDGSAPTHYMNPQTGRVEKLTANALEHTGTDLTENETPLEMPAMNFSKDKSTDNGKQENGDALPLPQMEF